VKPAPLPERRIRDLKSTTGPVTGTWGPILTTLRDASPGSLGSNLPGRIRLIAHAPAQSCRATSTLLQGPGMEWVALENPDRGRIDMFTL
jgi:hypothetical protein